jgi:hypothetical protein
MRRWRPQRQKVVARCTGCFRETKLLKLEEDALDAGSNETGFHALYLRLSDSEVHLARARHGAK